MSCKNVINNFCHFTFSSVHSRHLALTVTAILDHHIASMHFLFFMTKKVFDTVNNVVNNVLVILEKMIKRMVQ